MKYLLLLLFVVTAPLIQLGAQSTDPELAEKLKSVMSLFDKNQKALKDEITQLSSSNMALIQSNLTLYQDLQFAHKSIESLEAENLLLRSKISEMAVSELESAALQPKRITPETTSSAPSGNEPPSDQNQSATHPNIKLININTASKEALTKIPSVDEAMAEQIISHRPYETIEDLIINQGFGPRRLGRVAPYITTN